MNEWLQALMQMQGLYSQPNPAQLAPGNFLMGAPGASPFKSGPTNALNSMPGPGFTGYADDNTFYGPTSPTGGADWSYVGQSAGNPRRMNSQQKSGGTYMERGSGPVNIWKKATPATPAAAAAPAASTPAAAPQQSNGVSAEAGNPALRIPGVDVRLTGDQIGVQPAESSTAKSKKTLKGTSQLTIPRSVGASTVNIG